MRPAAEDEDAAGGGGELSDPLQTALRWHPVDGGRVEQALRVARDALTERASSSRIILGDPQVFGLADPDKLRTQVADDDAAAAVLTALLDRVVHQSQ